MKVLGSSVSGTTLTSKAVKTPQYPALPAVVFKVMLELLHFTLVKHHHTSVISAKRTPRDICHKRITCFQRDLCFDRDFLFSEQISAKFLTHDTQFVCYDYVAETQRVWTFPEEKKKKKRCNHLKWPCVYHWKHLLHSQVFDESRYSDVHSNFLPVPPWPQAHWICAQPSRRGVETNRIIETGAARYCEDAHTNAFTNRSAACRLNCRRLWLFWYFIYVHYWSRHCPSGKSVFLDIIASCIISWIILVKLVSVWFFKASEVNNRKTVTWIHVSQFVLPLSRTGGTLQHFVLLLCRFRARNRAMVELS